MEQTLTVEADLWLRVFMTHSGRIFNRPFDGLSNHSNHYIGIIYLCGECFAKKREWLAGSGSHSGGDRTPVRKNG